MNDEKHTGGWTLSTLFKHITQRFNDFNEAFKVFRDTVNRDAIKQNEFRQSLDDLGQKMQTKLEAQALQKSNDDKFNKMSDDIKDLRSRLDIGNPAIGILQNQQAAQSGGTKATDKTIAYLVMVVSIIFGAAGLAVAIFK